MLSNGTRSPPRSGSKAEAQVCPPEFGYSAFGRKGGEHEGFRVEGKIDDGILGSDAEHKMECGEVKTRWGIALDFGPKEARHVYTWTKNNRSRE